MKDLIKNYQENNDSTKIIARLMTYVNQDLTALKYKGEAPKVDHGLKYVAYRIRAFMLKNCFAERNARNKTERSDQANDYDGLHEFLVGLYEADWIELDWRELNHYDFSSVYANEREIRDYLGATAHEFFHLLKQFDGLSQNSEEFQEDFRATKENLLPLFEEGFLYAIGKVDLERSDKEIVKFINKAMLTKFIELQMKRDNVKRIRKGKKSTYVKVETDIEQDIWMMMFGKTLKNCGGVEAFALWLTPSQVEFLNKTYAIIEADLLSNNVGAFKWKENGKAVLNKRRIAERLEMSETNFKQTLKRCEKKIKDNWQTVIAKRTF